MERSSPSLKGPIAEAKTINSTESASPVFSARSYFNSKKQYHGATTL
ncbi:16190_t:CDS:1, partial [Rhizophagus irregularis]